MKILLYTFYNRWGLCSRVVEKITNPVGNSHGHSLQLEKYFINGLNGVKGLLKEIENDDYDLVIGLGDYRKDSKKIRFETKFINKYGRNLISDNGKDFYNVDEMFVDFCKEQIYLFPTDCQISTTITNGPCNRSGYLVSELIERKGLKPKFMFLHVPKSLEIVCVKKFILSLIQKLIKKTEIPKSPPRRDT